MTSVGGNNLPTSGDRKKQKQKQKHAFKRADPFGQFAVVFLDVAKFLSPLSLFYSGLSGAGFGCILEIATIK